LAACVDRRLSWYSKTLVSSLIESAGFNVISAALAAGGVFAFQVPFFDGFGFVLLVVSSILMLVGGAMSFATPGTSKVVSLLMGRKSDMTTQDYQKAQHRAALYAITGVILFAESLTLAATTLAGA
jgi:hypothetical protein